MEVKIYRELENENLILDEVQLKEYNALALELGLATTENVEKNNTPNVYICLNVAMQKQLKAICPSEVDADKYTKTTIPLDVLKVYKYCLDNNMFDGLKIWYNDIDPDPMLIGWKWQSEHAKSNSYTWQVDRFLIARWGDCAMEIEELLKLGFEKLTQELKDKAISAIDKCNSVLANPDVYVRKILSNNVDFNIDLNTSGSGTIY